MLVSAKCSSRSNCSRAGGGGSRRIGGKTAGLRGGKGHLNMGGINVRGSCLSPRALYNSIASGISMVSN